MYRQSSQTPSHFKDSARSAIYRQLPVALEAGLIRLAPSHGANTLLFHSLALLIFSSTKRLVRLAPLIYLTLTATIPEDREAISITVDQLVNDITLDETQTGEKISLGLELDYQHQEMFIDWNLNVTRCKLMLCRLPQVTLTPDFGYQDGVLPQVVGDLARQCQIILLSPVISDTDLIYTLWLSNLYREHGLDEAFRKNVAEVSVKQSRLLQINNAPSFNSNHPPLRQRYKEIAIRNYLINLAAAALTSHEYKQVLDQRKLDAKAVGQKVGKDEKKRLWDEVRTDVFRRAGLSE